MFSCRNARMWLPALPSTDFFLNYKIHFCRQVLAQFRAAEPHAYDFFQEFLKTNVTSV